jgi:phosphoribosylaminoimidazolecarboxamide formyltransferase/IMP cyclohydrolase
MSKTNKKFALISVFNKKGVANFAKTLLDLDFEIISTKGTGKELKSKG